MALIRSQGKATTEPAVSRGLPAKWLATTSACPRQYKRQADRTLCFPDQTSSFFIYGVLLAAVSVTVKAASVAQQLLFRET